MSAATKPAQGGQADPGVLAARHEPFAVSRGAALSATTPAAGQAAEVAHRKRGVRESAMTASAFEDAWRFGGYVEPGEEGWDRLFEASVSGRSDDPSIVEALEEATAGPRHHLDSLLDQTHAYGGELLAKDLEVAVDALLAAQAGVYRAALRTRGGVA
jgi:hypothetical protein